jgi:hypothetical protein
MLVLILYIPYDMTTAAITTISNGNASETKANESFDNGVFLDIEAGKQIIFERK